LSTEIKELGRFSDLAFFHARQALLLAPGSSTSHHALALACWFSGKTSPALQSYRTALSLNPNDPDLMADLGLRYCQLMDWERGVPLVEESYRRNPCQPGIYRMAFVLCHFAGQRYAEGLHEAQMLDAPDVVCHHFAVAACAVRLGLRQMAQDAIANIERIEPDFAQRVAFDLASCNIHPKLAQDLVAALCDAGLEGAAISADARKT
jgi:tetratricopeptide (TPR) repeat protein